MDNVNLKIDILTKLRKDVDSTHDPDINIKYKYVAIFFGDNSEIMFLYIKTSSEYKQGEGTLHESIKYCV